MSGGTTAVSIAVTAISTAVGMYAQHQQQKAQEKSAKAAATYNAQVAENEAATQRQLAQNEVAKGAAERSLQQRKAARAMGEMRSGMGASGFEMDTGSMVSLLEESAVEHQYDSSVIGNNAAQAAWGHMVGVTAANNNQSFANWQGANADSGRMGSYLGMGGTLLGGISDGMNSYNKWNSTASPGQIYETKKIPGQTNYRSPLKS